MKTFDQNNLEHIKAIFEAKTGVELEKRSPRRKFRTALLLAAVLCCLTVSVVATPGLFSVLDGDDLTLSSEYEGEGIVSIQVENRSDRDLEFQPQLRLSRWSTSEEIKAKGPVHFENTNVPARSTRTMIVDLSQAYDMEKLEQALADDWYYLTLTNHNFVFGQDWFCSVDFAENYHTPIGYPEAPQPDPAVLAHIQESLRPYFEKNSLEVQDRRVGEASYVQNYTSLLEDFEGKLVSPVSPVLPGPRIDKIKIDTENPYLTVKAPEGVIFDDAVPADEQAQLTWQNWFARDGYFKLVTRQGEYALQIAAILPAESGNGGAIVPILYILTYEKDDVTDDSYAFIYGRLMTFAQLEEYKVYEDDSHICYEVSGLMYTDLMTYAEEYVRACTSARWDEQSQRRLQNIYGYYKENLKDLFVYR